MIVYAAFVSHGSPEILLHEDDKWIDTFRKVGRSVKQADPETIIMISPHFFTNSDLFLIPSQATLSSVQDYYGFPEELYQYNYTFKNDTDAVKEILKLAPEHGVEVTGIDGWGLDHGSWIPLKFMDVMDRKYVTMSVNRGAPERHIALGKLIARATQAKRVAVIATGSPTHSFYGKAFDFDKLLIKVIEEGKLSQAVSLESTSEYALSRPEGMNRPFYVLAGALNDIRGKIIDYQIYMPGLSMLAAEFAGGI
ncbi:MAG: dioxygenase [Nitrososphaerota archaeon]|nr:dioxygenase [Nitrososphaerota archaeon]